MPHISVTALETPAKPAIVMAANGETVSYGELDSAANRGAQLLRTCGVHKGDHIALMLHNCKEFLEIACAAMRAGVIFTPISTHLKDSETAYILQNCGAKLFVVSDTLADIGAMALDQVPEIAHRFVLGGARDGFDSWEEAVERMPDSPIDDPAMGAPMLYSSGTTGKPKGVFIPPASDDHLAPHTLEPTVGAFFGFSPETTYLSPAPLYHAAPLHYNLLVLATGGTTVVMDKFDAEGALALIEEYRITHSQWVPIMFVRMLKLPEETRKRFDTSSMQVAIHAAAPCPIEVKEAMIEWWGPVIYEYYAASEGIGFTLISAEDWLAHKGSVGRPLFGQPHICNDDGEELPPGEIGLVWFENEGQGFEYHGEPAKTAEAYDKRGWATTGDVGYLDTDGYLYLTDRKNFTIISGGVNIYSAEIENLLITHGKVADVAVFGVPHEEFGEAVTAVVQPVDWADATDETAYELLAWLRERLSHVKLPKVLHFHEQLPRLDNGKLYKRHLMEAYRGRE